MNNVTSFLARRRKLKVNEAKSAVARPETRKFLGFSFSRNKEPKRRISPKALLRCKQKIRELTRRTRGISLEQMTKELAAYLRELLRLLSDPAPGDSRIVPPCITRSPWPTLTHSIFLDSSTDWRNPLNRRTRTRISAGVAGESG